MHEIAFDGDSGAPREPDEGLPLLIAKLQVERQPGPPSTRIPPRLGLSRPAENQSAAVHPTFVAILTAHPRPIVPPLEDDEDGAEQLLRHALCSHRRLGSHGRQRRPHHRAPG
jgi:hypothetical protein